MHRQLGSERVIEPVATTAVGVGGSVCDFTEDWGSLSADNDKNDDKGETTAITATSTAAAAGNGDESSHDPGLFTDSSDVGDGDTGITLHHA